MSGNEGMARKTVPQPHTGISVEQFKKDVFCVLKWVESQGMVTDRKKKLHKNILGFVLLML